MQQVEEGQFSTEGSVHLDTLRALAALAVVLGHTRSLYFSSTVTVPTAAAVPSGTAKVVYPAGSVDRAAQTGLGAPPAAAAEPRITIGSEAVMIFFVLSGFLVGGSVLRSFRKDMWSWSDYLVKRLTRLWVVLIPALLLGLVIDHAGIRLFGGQSIYGSPTGQLIVTGNVLDRLRLPVLLGNILFTQDILVGNLGVNESLWSLALEFWYYILFPLLMILVLGRSKLAHRLLAVGGVAVISYFLGSWIMKHFLVWLLGALIAWLPLRFSERTAKRLAFAAAGVLVLAMPLARRAPISVYAAECLFAALSGCLIYLIKHLGQKRRPDWYSAASGFLSRMSYTLYLVHLPLAVFACGLLNRPWHIWAKTGTNVSIWLGTNVVVIAVAYAFYRMFEANTDIVRKTLTRAMGRQKISV